MACVMPASRSRCPEGVEAAGSAAFVLVAGGLGERLGYSGIKLALPADSARGACYLQVGRRSGHISPRIATPDGAGCQAAGPLTSQNGILADTLSGLWWLSLNATQPTQNGWLTASHSRTVQSIDSQLPEGGTRPCTRRQVSIHSSALTLQVYAESILALQHKAHEGGSSNLLPLVIMTSDDTHQRTQQLLDSHSFFGLSPKQVHLLKQEKVRSPLWAQAGCTAGQYQLRHLEMLLAATKLAAQGKVCTLHYSCIPGQNSCCFHGFICTGHHAVHDIWFTAAEGRLAAPGTCVYMPHLENLGRL